MLIHLPKCTNLQGERCSFQAVNTVLEGDANEIKPCVKLDYKGDETTYHDRPKGKMARYLLLFSNPPKVIVQEEYLIYDGIALISAIGGTLGLCIGFSFFDFFGFLLRYLEHGIEKFSECNTISSNTAIRKVNGSVQPIDNNLEMISRSLTKMERKVSAIEYNVQALQIKVRRLETKY